MSPPTFATVAEGATDHAVLQNVLLGFFKRRKLDSGCITAVQPLLDRTGKQVAGSFGGWREVLRWLELKKYADAFQFNDHVVVHIDSDDCEAVELGVAKAPGGVALPVAELVSRIREKIEAIVGPDDLQKYEGRFHLAVAVHSIECWLLPLWGRRTELAGTLDCYRRVNSGLRRQDLPVLRKEAVGTYDTASAPYRKKRNLDEALKSQESLARFCKSLSSV